MNRELTVVLQRVDEELAEYWPPHRRYGRVELSRRQLEALAKLLHREDER